MTPEDHRLLVETRELIQENNVILKSLQRTYRLSLILKVVYWVVIIGASFGAFYLFQPYIDGVKNSISAIEQNPSVAAEAFTFSGALKNIKEIKGLYSE